VVLRNLRTSEGNVVLALLVIVDEGDVPQEKFLGIYGFQKFDAKSISERMLSILYEIDLRKLLAQCYDGASVMSGKHGGAQALISQYVKRDVPYIQYFRHQLNLIYLFTSRHEVHGINTHTLQNSAEFSGCSRVRRLTCCSRVL